MICGMDRDVAVLRRFNEKVRRLEESSFAKRFSENPPEVVARVEDFSLRDVGNGKYEFIARIWSEVADFHQDEIDAFVLTYRFFIQDTDDISIRSIAAIYKQAWMPREAAERFNEARTHVNAYLDSTTSVLIGDRSITRRYLVDIIIYGSLAHLNPSKQRVFQDWMEAGGINGFLWAEFIATMKDMLGYLGYFRSLNEAIIGRCSA